MLDLDLMFPDGVRIPTKLLQRVAGLLNPVQYRLMSASELMDIGAQLDAAASEQQRENVAKAAAEHKD